MKEPVLPDELADLLLADRVAAAAFEAMSVGGRIHYARWVASCRNSDTRTARARDAARIFRAQAERERRERKRLGPSPWSKPS